jgi:hypothetical protein
MKKLLFIITTALLVLGTSCEDFLSVNEKNPNQASQVPANLILPAAQNNTGRLFAGNPGQFQFIYTWYGCWSISGGYSQDANMTGYNLLNSHFQGNWQNAYYNLQNYDYIIKNSTTAKQRPWKAIAKIMQVYIYQNLVDCYGNIPYSEALKTDEGILKPKYDDQKTIYEDLIVQLDTAMNLITKSPADADEVGEYDMIYGGDMALWKKFANTLKLRILVNQSGMTGRDTYIKSNLAATASVGYLGAGESAMLNPGYVKSSGKMNPFWERFYKQDDSQQSDGLGYFVAGADACKFLNDNADPRRFRYFTAVSGTTAGNIFGTVPLLLPSVTSKIGPGLLKAYNMDSPIFTDFESLFLQAEAVQRTLITGDAKALYESAVTQSIIYMGGTSGTAAAAATYLAQAKPLVSYDGSPNKLQAILTQKWLALNGISAMPIWTDYRRTGYPLGTDALPANNTIHFSQDAARLSDTPPVRLLYPQTEINTNNDNVKLQGVNKAEDTFTKKIFWQNR